MIFHPQIVPFCVAREWFLRHLGTAAELSLVGSLAFLALVVRVNQDSAWPVCSCTVHRRRSVFFQALRRCTCAVYEALRNRDRKNINIYIYIYIYIYIKLVLDSSIRGCTLGGHFQFFKDRKSAILGVWAAPGAPETIPLGGWLRPPPFGRVSGARGATQTPKMTEFRSL